MTTRRGMLGWIAGVLGSFFVRSEPGTADKLRESITYTYEEMQETRKEATMLRDTVSAVCSERYVNAWAQDGLGMYTFFRVCFYNFTISVILNYDNDPYHGVPHTMSLEAARRFMEKTERYDALRHLNKIVERHGENMMLERVP